MKRYLYLAIVFVVVSIIGLISFLNSTRSVNLGAFIIPLILGGGFGYLYYKNKSET